ncbi:MAG: hypothetical protein CMF23_17420 [Ignavibacteriae bacterium]|nr:hypothetical protein [Ignavibacteriota bacterium]|tara:strand:- start:159 stop:410 length:252 start_codon:yes stop_codon:yes gene_type:complete
MIIPSKYELLKHNSLFIGALVLDLLKQQPLNFFSLYNKIYYDKRRKISYLNLLDTLTFLFLADLVYYSNNKIHFKYDSQKTLF